MVKTGFTPKQPVPHRPCPSLCLQVLRSPSARLFAPAPYPTRFSPSVLHPLALPQVHLPQGDLLVFKLLDHKVRWSQVVPSNGNICDKGTLPLHHAVGRLPVIHAALGLCECRVELFILFNFNKLWVKSVQLWSVRLFGIIFPGELLLQG